jgi:hypothetical protein
MLHQELIEGMDAKFGRCKEESGLEDADAGAGRDGVKVLDLQLGDCVVLVRECDLVQVAILTLYQIHPTSQIPTSILSGI